MRILGIRFRNINSLAGEWQVDFTRPEYTGDGIFAITGPTGAGKTTLLDVICLALYGRTPRLERINKSGNDVMTRQTGECMAEVTFSTTDGTYRCHWSQHRARRKPDGDLQTPRHEISDAVSGRIIDSQIRTVAQRIESVTGMNFERFTQSMLLAQGGFAAFLKASADERAPILEQITGTAIYSDISVKVHERHALERNQLQLLQSEFNGLQLLTPEQEAALTHDIAVSTAELGQAVKLREFRRKARDWKHAYLKVEHALAQRQRLYSQWLQQDADFEPERERLARALRAQTLAVPYSDLIRLRQRRQENADNLQQLQAAGPDLQNSADGLRAVTEQASDRRQQAEKKLSDMRPVLRQVHVLDSQIIQQRRELAQAEADCKTQWTALQDLQQQIATTQQQINVHTQTLQQLGANGESGHEGLLQQLTGNCKQLQQQMDGRRQAIDALCQGKSLLFWQQRSAQLAALITQCDGLTQLYQDLDNLQTRLNERVVQQKGINSRLHQLAVDHEHGLALLSAQETALSALQKQQSLQNTIRQMETQRALLTEGDPCPLCGALQHPFASHTPDADIDALNKRVAEAESLRNDCKTRQQEIHNDQLRQQEKLTLLTNLIAEEQQLYDTLTGKIDAQRKSLDMPTGISPADFRMQLHSEQHQIRESLQSIESEQHQLQLFEKKLQLAREQLADINNTVKDLQHMQDVLQSRKQQLAAQSAQADELGARAETQRTVLGDLQQQRQQLLGGQDAESVEKTLEAELAEADAALQHAKRQLQEAEQQLHNHHRQCADLTQQISDGTDSIKAAETAFRQQLKTQDFATEQEYLAAALPDAERQQLQQRLEQLQLDGTAIRTMISQYKTEMDNLMQEADSSDMPADLADTTPDALQQQLAVQEQQVAALQETLGGLRRELSNNAELRNRQKAQAEKIDAQKIELERWSVLHDLIGSADGKKFRNFAQGLTFELMISHANQQLRKMTDRYLLLRDKVQPLELNVIDYYQAGEIRPTKNLSGGESFIVSLALALGLSRMASRHVRVDSLFLDEGFGTLDDDALDTALETLSGLQQEGKLIGVISHISALKERIGTRIRVIPGPGGRSVLRGPGCSAL